MRFQPRSSSRLLTLVLATCIAPSVVGCYPVTQLQGPRTVAPGKLQGAVALGAQVPQRSPDYKSRGLPLPLDVALRYGATDAVDLTFRTRPAFASLGDSVLELGAKFQLVREKEIELSIAPSLLKASVNRRGLNDESTITPDERSSFTYGRLAMIVGTNADDTGSLWIAPTIDVGTRRYPVGDAMRSEPLVAFGSCAGVGLRLGTHVQLLLQGGVAAGLAGEELAQQGDRQYETILGPGNLITEVTLGLLIGGFRD